jgi:hypothetical protein
LQAILLDIYQTEVLAVAAVLPLQLNRGPGCPLEIQLAQYVTLVFTPDGRLPGSEKSSVVLATKYSHFLYSLRRCVAIQAVFYSKHEVLG